MLHVLSVVCVFADWYRRHWSASVRYGIRLVDRAKQFLRCDVMNIPMITRKMMRLQEGSMSQLACGLMRLLYEGISEVDKSILDTFCVMFDACMSEFMLIQW